MSSTRQAPGSTAVSHSSSPAAVDAKTQMILDRLQKMRREIEALEADLKKR